MSKDISTIDEIRILGEDLVGLGFKVTLTCYEHFFGITVFRHKKLLLDEEIALKKADTQRNLSFLRNKLQAAKKHSLDKQVRLFISDICQSVKDLKEKGLFVSHEISGNIFTACCFQAGKSWAVELNKDDTHDRLFDVLTDINNLKVDDSVLIKVNKAIGA